MNEVKYTNVFGYAIFMDVTEKTIYNWIQSGRIPPENIKEVLKITLIKKVIV